MASQLRGSRTVRRLRSFVLAHSRWQSPERLSRLDAIQCAIDRLDARSYLEIGVDQGHVFTEIRVARKAGVDPVAAAPAVAQIDGTRGVSYHQMGSDAFFAQVAPALLAGGIDVAFIDGLHTYQQTYRDCINALEYLTPGGVILVHDCLPKNANEARVAADIADAWRINGPDWDGNWTGDVWKTIVMLRALHPELEVDVLNSDHGIGVLRRGKSDAPLALDRTAIEQMDFADLQRDPHRLLGLQQPSDLWRILNELRAARTAGVQRGWRPGDRLHSRLRPPGATGRGPGEPLRSGDATRGLPGRGVGRRVAGASRAGGRPVP